MSTPLMIVGDGPQEHTGLGRIARDLSKRILNSDLDLDLIQVGGSIPPLWKAWKHLPLDRREDWGASCVEEYWKELWGNQPGILWCCWDPGRLLPYTQIQSPVQRWAYTAVDAQNGRGGIGGPAAAALQQFDRVLGYGRWGSQILKSVRGVVPYLPHGLELDTYQDAPTVPEDRWVDQQLGPHAIGKWILGCVATNQPRKDLGW